MIFHPRLLPARVIIDPELTLGLPTGVTVATDKAQIGLRTATG